jgi:hypothetical protein
VGSLARRNRNEDDNLIRGNNRFADPDKTAGVDITGMIIDVMGMDWAEQEWRRIFTGACGHTEHGSYSEYIKLKITSNEIAKPHVVDLPYYSFNQLDLLVLGNILIGETVHYHKEMFERSEGYCDYERHSEWSLEMLTGKMAGHIYKMREDN